MITVLSCFFFIFLRIINYRTCFFFNYLLYYVIFICIGFKFDALHDEDSVWVKTYNQFIQSFSDFTVFLPRINKVLRWFDRTRREQYEAGFKMAELLDNMAKEKKQALLNKKNKKEGDDIPDSEKDLLTLMLEAEMDDKEGVSLTKEELRVSYYIRKKIGIIYI